MMTPGTKWNPKTEEAVPPNRPALTNRAPRDMLPARDAAGEAKSEEKT